MNKEKMISKIFKRLSIFLIFAMVIGLLHPETASAKLRGYSIFKKLDNGYSIIIKWQEYIVASYGMLDDKNKIVLPIDLKFRSKSGSNPVTAMG